VVRRGLGRGLDALIPVDTGEAASGELKQLPVGSIRPNRYQPRGEFDEAALSELAASIRELGVLQPVLVRPAGDGTFELIAGERRWRAAQEAGMTSVPALVRTVTDDGALEQALVENLQRDDLNPVDTARAFQRLCGEFGLTQDQIADRVGKSRSAVANTLRLLHLSPRIQGFVASGVLSAGHARALLGTDDEKLREELADKILASALTVRAVEEAVRRGTDRATRPAGAPGTTKPPALLELEGLLSDKLDTTVKVEFGGRRGRIEILFADLEDLERIFVLLS
jgi:ParB family chromosome partitioning protein